MAFPPNNSETTGPIFNKFSDLVDLWVADNKSNISLRSSKGRCCGKQLICGTKNTLHLTNATFTLYTGFQNELEYRNADARINIGDDAATSCENLVNFSPLIPGVYGGNYWNFLDDACTEIAISWFPGDQLSQDLLDRFSSNFHQMVDNWSYVDEQSDLTFPIAQGTLPWQPILWAKLSKLVYSLLFVALAFRDGLEYCNVDRRVNSGRDLATSCKNLMKFGPVTPDFRGWTLYSKRQSALGLV